MLRPWLDVDPDAVLPGHGPVAALLAALGPDAEAGMRRRDDLHTRPVTMATVTPIRPRDLVLPALVAAVVVHLLVRLSYGSLPAFPLSPRASRSPCSAWPRRSAARRCASRIRDRPGRARCHRSSRPARCSWRARPRWRERS